MSRVTIGVALLLFAAAPANAQLATVGAGALLSDRAPELVAEIHLASPQLFRARAYVTSSWTDDSAKPTLITAAERSLLAGPRVSLGLGAGLLWLEGNDYRPYPIAVGSAVMPVGIPRTSAVAIASTQPFQDFSWSLVLKVAVLAWFGG